MFTKQLLLLAKIKKLDKNCFFFRLDFILSLNQTIPSLLRGHCRYVIVISKNTIFILKNIIITIVWFNKFDVTLTGIDVRNIKGFKK
jgi:hypothetical protein